MIFIYWEKAFPAVANNIGGFWPSAFNHTPLERKRSGT